MIAIFLIPIYLLICAYVIRWALRWLKACHGIFDVNVAKTIFVIIFLLFATTPLSSFLIKANPLHRILKAISNVWLGAFLYMILSIVIVDLIRFIIKRAKLMSPERFQSPRLFVTVGAVILIFIISVSTYGVFHAGKIQTTSYDVTVPKDGGNIEDLKVVLVADLHMGYSIGCRHITKMVDKINAEQPDLVLMAGDVFDNEYEALDDPEELQKILAGIQSTYGVYSTFGNHDLEEAILAGFTFSSGADKQRIAQDNQWMEDFFEKANIRLLRDEAVLIDDSFYVVGRKDCSRAKKLGDERLSAADLMHGLDMTKPILVVDHQPKEYQELADAGVDIDFGGHTHDGQVFPGNLTINLMWENACGYLQKDKMHTIVTSGVGIWGPAMRIGTKSEIVVTNVTFAP